MTMHRQEPRHGGARRGRQGTAFFVLALVLAVLAGACGSGGPAQMDPAKAKAAIGRAYATLFNFANRDVEAKTAVIQDGSSLRTAITQALSSPLAKKATGAKVSAVQLLSATRCGEAALPSPCARVTYDLLGPSARPLFTTPSTGYAVHVRDRWLVAKSTICALLGLFYSASGQQGQPPGC